MPTYRGHVRTAILSVISGVLFAFLGFTASAQAVQTQAWSAVGPLTAVGTPNPYVVLNNGSDVYIAGNFQDAGGNADADYLAKWDGATWSAVGNSPGGGTPRLNAAVQSAAIVGTTLYLGGDFSSAGGVAGADAIAKVDLSSGVWSKLGAGGGPYGLSANAHVYAMYVDTTTTPTSLLFGGAFIDAGSVAETRYAARYLPGTDAFAAIGGTTSYMGASAQVTAIDRIGSTYYFGFSNVGSGNSYGLLRKYSGGVWSDVAWGTTWSSAKSFVSGDYAGVYALHTVGSQLYIGGNFLNAGGTHNYLARLDTSTSTWYGVGSDSGCPGSFPTRCVRDFFDLDGSVYFTGDIGIYRVSGATNQQYPLTLGGAPPTAYSAATSSHAFTASGVFTDAGGVSSADYLAKFTTSTVSTLDSLSVSAGVLNTSFASGTTSYTVSTGSGSTTLTAVASNGSAGIDYRMNNGTWTALPTTGTSDSISLTQASNTLEVRVDPSDSAGTAQSYTVTINRPPSSDATLSALSMSSGTLSPSFSSGTSSYTSTVSTDTSTITVTPTKSHTGASITVNGVSVTSGSASGSIALSPGPNTVTIEVTAETAATQQYVITVTRTPSTNAALSWMTVTGVTLSPFFSQGTYSYTSSVSAAVTSTTVTPTTAQSGATVKVNGVTTTSGSPSGSINLAFGANTITTVVTAQDGVTTKSYTVTIYRGSADTDLAGLTLSAGSLSPEFAAATTAYTATVPNSNTSIALTPTTAHSGASVTVNGSTVTSGVASGNIALDVGANTVTIIVTSQNAAATKSTTVTITREAAALPAPTQEPAQSSGGGSVVTPSPSSDSTSAPTPVAKGTQTAPKVVTKLKVKKKFAIATKTPQGGTVSIKASGACKASGTTITAGKSPGKCSVAITAPSTDTLGALSVTLSIKIVK